MRTPVQICSVIAVLAMSLAARTVAAQAFEGNAVDREAYLQMLDDVTHTATREKAADELAEFAKSHPETQNHIGHVFASRHTHLDAAEVLVRESIERLEQETSDITDGPIVADDMEAMDDLAEYWDSMGWVFYAKKDLVAAKRYCQAAWELGGEGLYLGHVAILASEAGDDATAIHLLRVAMTGKMDAREMKANLDKLKTLHASDTRPIDEHTEVSVDRAADAIGTADLYLIFYKGKVSDVLWMNPYTAITAETKGLQEAKYPIVSPDDGPEYLVRKGVLTCTASGCTVRLLYAWEVLEQLREDGPASPKAHDQVAALIGGPVPWTTTR